MDAHEDHEHLRKFQEQMLKMSEENCNVGNIHTPGWCPEIWDGILCWRSTAPGGLAVEPCPHYIVGFDLPANATRQCMPDGEWYWSKEKNGTWANYTDCYTTREVTLLVDIPDIPEVATNNQPLVEFVPIVKTVATVGYTVSLFTLIVAFCILATIKKLRCQRNILHMHLFASFMMRASIALLKDILFPTSGLSDIVITDGESYWLGKDSTWSCKMFTSFWQYFILANYFWILMEGLYLHNLVFLALFTEANSSILVYICLGWGLPAAFVVPWVITRILFDDTFCWTTHKIRSLFYIIRIPTTLSVLINFALFLNIVRVLMLKLKSTVSEETQRYKRWARSTLVLVPLFGVHYAMFLGMSYEKDAKVEAAWLFCDQLFASFQGFFVAVLYCFLNGEVRTEVSRAIRSSKCPRFRGRWGPRPSTHSSSSCSCNASKIEKGSRRPRWWKVPWTYLFRSRKTRRSMHSMASTQDVGTRGGSLASSRGYLEIAGNGQHALPGSQSQSANHTSPLCSKYTDQSLLSFCSNMSETSAYAGTNIEKVREQHRWSDSECCHLAYELHSLQQHGHS